MVPAGKALLGVRKNYQSLVLFILLTAYFLLFCQYGFNLWDEGALLNGGLRVLDGDLPIRDFNGYPPGRYFLASAIFFLFGEEIFPLRAAVSILTALSVVCLFKVARQLMPPPFALLSSLLYLCAPAVYYNRFFPIFLIFGIYFIFKMVDSKGWQRALWLLLATLLTLVFKFEVAVIMYITGVIVLFRDGHSGKRIAFGIGIVPALGVIGYAGANFFRDFFKLLFQSYEEWGTPFPVPAFHAPILEILLNRGFFDALLFYYPPCIYALTVSYLIFRFLRSAESRKDQTAKILVVLFVGAFSFGLVVWRSGFDNLVRVLPPATVLLGFLFSLCYQKLKGLSLVSTFFFLSFIPSWYLYQMVWNHGFYVGSVGVMREEARRLPFQRGEVFTNKFEHEWAVEIVTFITENTGKADTVLALPLNSVWNFLADRKNPTSYEWVIPSTMRKPFVERDVIREITKNPPKLIVLSDIAIDNRESRRFSRYGRNIFNYILENYRLVREVGIFLVFERKNT